MMETVAMIFSLAALACFVLGLAGLFKPGVSILPGAKTRAKAVGGWLAIGVACFAIAGVVLPREAVESARVANAERAQIQAQKDAAINAQVEQNLADARARDAAKAAAAAKLDAARKSYSVAKAEKLANIKLALDVVITAPVDKETLATIARELWVANDGKRFERVFVTWYLPHYKMGAGAWATTHFEGKAMDVQIMALQGE